MSIVEDTVEFFESIPGAIVGVLEDPIGAFEDLFEGAGDVVNKVVHVFTESPECIILAGSPAYWELVRNLTLAKATGLINNQQNCETSREKVAKAFPVINNIPGIEYFWGCACKMALSDAAVPTSIVTTAATATAQFALSQQDQITGVISAASWGPNRLDLFIRGNDNTVWHGLGKKSWTCLGGQIQQPPAIVTWGAGRLDIFVCGSDRGLWHKCWNDNAGWYPSAGTWSPLGGQMLGGPSVATWGPGTLHVVVRGTDNAVYYKGYNEQTGWTNWASLGGGITHAPRLVSWGPGRLDLVARGSDGAVWHRCFDKRYNVWSDWASLGGQIIGSPSVTSWGWGRLDLVVRGTDGAVWHKCYHEGDGWYPSLTEWASIGGNIKGTPSITSWGYGRLDMVARGADGAVWHKSYQEGAGWYPSLMDWTSLGGKTSGSPTIIACGKDRVDIMARGESGGVWHKYYQLPSTFVGHVGAGAEAANKAEYAKRWHPSLTDWDSLGMKII